MVGMVRGVVGRLGRAVDQCSVGTGHESVFTSALSAPSVELRIKPFFPPRAYIRTVALCWSGLLQLFNTPFPFRRAGIVNT